MKTKIVQSHADPAGYRAEDDDTVIRTAGFSKRFGEVHALHPLDLEVPRHSIFLGPNEAGKSTTIKLLLGLGKPSGRSGQHLRARLRSRQRGDPGKVDYLARDPRFYTHMACSGDTGVHRAVLLPAGEQRPSSQDRP